MNIKLVAIAALASASLAQAQGIPPGTKVIPDGLPSWADQRVNQLFCKVWDADSTNTYGVVVHKQGVWTPFLKADRPEVELVADCQKVAGEHGSFGAVGKPVAPPHLRYEEVGSVALSD